MKLTLAEPKYLKDSISIISELVNEATFRINKDKIELVAMDPANVAMVIFNLLSSAFVEYDVKENKNISISLDSLNQILKRAKPSDMLTLELEDNKLKVSLKGDSNRTFKLSLIDLDEEQQKIPKLTFPLEIEAPSIVFNDAIEDVGIISESVALVANKNKFLLKSDGNLHNAKVELVENDEVKIKNKSEDVSAKYSLDYLKKMIKGSKLSNKVTLEFNSEYPLKMSYKVIDKLSLDFILAPRVDN